MYKKYSPRGFTVVSVSNDQTAQEAGSYAKKTRATFPVVHDPKSAVYNKLGVSAAPTNVLVDRSGKVVYSREGGDITALEAAVTRAMGGK